MVPFVRLIFHYPGGEDNPNGARCRPSYSNIVLRTGPSLSSSYHVDISTSIPTSSEYSEACVYGRTLSKLTCDKPYLMSLSPHDHVFAGHSGYLQLMLSYILQFYSDVAVVIAISHYNSWWYINDII